MNSFDDSASSRSEYYETQEDQSVNTSATDTLGDILQRRFSRRDFLRGSLVVSVMGEWMMSPPVALADAETSIRYEGVRTVSSRFSFSEISHGVDENHHVAPVDKEEIRIRGGELGVQVGPVFDPLRKSRPSQRGP